MGRTDTATRVIPADRERVYAALVEPEALVAWLPPGGMSGEFERFEAWPGGSYRLVLTYPDADAAHAKSGAGQDVVEARFVELVAGQRVVSAMDFESEDPAFHGTMTMTWELAETADGTRVEIRAENVPTGISAEDHAAGLASSLAQLADHLMP